MTGVAILTGGRDPHYALGLASALAARGMQIDLVGEGEIAKIDSMLAVTKLVPSLTVLYRND